MKLTDPGPVLVIAIIVCGLTMLVQALYDGLRK